jgi:hypothetical protein
MEHISKQKQKKKHNQKQTNLHSTYILTIKKKFKDIFLVVKIKKIIYIFSYFFVFFICFCLFVFRCTCDGCNARPIVGFRYKCTKVNENKNFYILKK